MAGCKRCVVQKRKGKEEKKRKKGKKGGEGKWGSKAFSFFKYIVSAIDFEQNFNGVSIRCPRLSEAKCPPPPPATPLIWKLFQNFLAVLEGYQLI